MAFLFDTMSIYQINSHYSSFFWLFFFFCLGEDFSFSIISSYFLLAVFLDCSSGFSSGSAIGAVEIEDNYCGYLSSVSFYFSSSFEVFNLSSIYPGCTSYCVSTWVPLLRPSTWSLCLNLQFNWTFWATYPSFQSQIRKYRCLYWFSSWKKFHF